MLAIGALSHTIASDLLRKKTERQLHSLAETKRDDLENVVLGWQDRVALIASRTQLRRSLDAFNRTGSREQQQQIRRILRDARTSSQVVQLLAIYDLEGELVASDWSEEEWADVGLEPTMPSGAREEVSYPEIHFTNGDDPLARFVTPLSLDGDRIGALEVVLSARELVSLTENINGLGDTGETMVVLRDAVGVPRALHPVRDRAVERPGVAQPERPDDPATLAIEGRDTVMLEGLRDYRGEPVWAATRFLPSVGWGVVVKFDATEERATILSLRSELAWLVLSLAAFAIVLGTFLGLRLAKPIHDLAGVANQIRLGELSARAKVVREDELGLLARTFNEMAEELEQQLTLLHEFQKYFEFSLDMLCIAGTDGYFKRVNPAFERTLGWSAEELLSQSFMDFVHPDDVESTAYEIERLSQGIPTISFENRYRCKDGSYKSLLWKSYPEAETGLLYAIARDITELKQAREQLRIAYDSDASE
jgi:PAS domain S-box-containing protein